MEDGMASRLLMRETRGKDGVSYSLEREGTKGCVSDKRANKQGPPADKGRHP